MDYIPPINGDTEDPDRVYVNGTAGVPGSGSIPDAAVFNTVFAEFLALIEGAGLTPDSENLAQVLAAVQALIAAGTLSALADVTITTPADGEALVYSGSGWVNQAVSLADATARKRIAMLAFNRAADHSASYNSLLKDFYDAFEDATGVDDGNSVNVNWSAAGYLDNGSGYGADLAAAATATASANFSGRLPAHAIDGDTATFWSAGQASGPHSLKLDLGDGNAAVVRRLTMKPELDGGGWGGIKNFILAGSNNDADYTTLVDDIGAENETVQTFDFANATAYRYWKITSDAGADGSYYSTGGWHVALAEVQLFALTEPDTMDYRSVAHEAAAEAAGGYLISTIEDVNSAGYTLNTDVMGYLSKDDGATWEAVTLELFDSIGGLDTIGGSIETMSVTGDKTWRQRIVLPDTDEFRLWQCGLQY